MSGKKSKWMLTKRGVFALYEENLKEEIKMQVIFKADIDDMWCLRLSDGSHISPIVYVLAKRINETFTVGAIITIKERIVVPNDPFTPDESRPRLEDTALHYVYIKSYKVFASAEAVGNVIGHLNKDDNYIYTYRDEMRCVLPALAKWQREDEQLRFELEDAGSYKKRQHEGVVLREIGNVHFKNGQYAEALNFYSMVIKQDRFDCRVWTNSSRALFKLENYIEAEVHAIFSMKMNPFYEKAYIRAGQAALSDNRPFAGRQYAMDGIFLCGHTKDLREILAEAIPMSDDFLAMGDSVYDTHREFFMASYVSSLEKVRSQTKGRAIFKEIQDVLQRKKIVELSNAFGREPRKESKKSSKKPKKPMEEAGTISAAAAAAFKEEEEEKTILSRKGKRRKMEEEESKKGEKNNNRNKNTSLNETLKEGRRLYQSEQYQQAIEMYNKCLAYSELTDNINSGVQGKKGERCEVQVIQFIIGMSKVQSGRGYIYEGLEIMQTLCGDGTKFPYKPAARYWLALSFEKIFCFKLALKHAQMCRDALKKHKNLKPIKWPGTDQNISKTHPNELEAECNELLERPLSARPTPKAKCRYKKCITTQGIPYAKEEIYLTDPDFKGYLNVICEDDCTVSYHHCCWKVFKEQHDGSINRMSDKDFLGQGCVTPDCTGKIFSIEIYDDTGELKNVVKKDKKNEPAPVKQKKKKEKKKEKNQTHKRRNRVESVCEEQGGGEEASAGGAENTGGQNSTTTTTITTVNNNNNNTTTNNNIKKSQPTPMLPIDAKSLETAQVTILKPGGESPTASPTKAAKKNKKKKSKKPVSQPNLLADPLESDLCVQNEYVARLRALQQQRDALEADGTVNASCPLSLTNSRQKQTMLLDPDNPFYLPQHLRDNPEELENVLQQKLTTNSPPGLQKETVNTLLDFMYDWLKSEGPMRTSDSRLAEQVSENFPQEAKDYVSRCGSIKEFLMQSIKFAMIDDIICVHDDVMKAQKMLCKDVSDKINRSKYLIFFSDGKKAKRFTHLLDDAKSTCSTASSSVAESFISRDSSAHNGKLSNHVNSSGSNGNHNNCDTESNASLAPVSKSIVEQLAMLSKQNISLDPAAPPFEPVVTVVDVPKENEEEYEEEEEEVKWSNGDSDYIENWAAQAREKTALMPEGEEEEELEMSVEAEEQGGEDHGEEEEQGEEEDEEEEEEEEGEEGEEEEGAESVKEEEENIEEYIIQLQDEKENLAQDIEKVQEQNEKLNDKLIQVKSQYKSEVMKLKQQIEELKDQNKELSTEKHAIQSQKETDIRKYKSDLSRATEELKTFQARVHSAEVKCEQYLDQKNEMEARLEEARELNTQLKDEIEKMGSLQESLTSCSRRAREAEVKYLSTKKDLVEASLSRAIKQLTEEAMVMKHMLPALTDTTMPDRNTLTHTIMAWEETVAGLLEQQRSFSEEGTRLLGMIHQGRPLSALPAGDLKIPIIPTLSVAPLLKHFQTNNHHLHHHQNNKPPPTPTPPPPHPPHPPPTLAVQEAMPMHRPIPSPSPQPPPSPHMSTPPPPLTEPPQVPLMSVALVQTAHHNGHPVYMHNGVPPPGLIPNHPPPSASNPATGAIPKGAGNPTPTKTPEIVTAPPQQQFTEPTSTLFVGQLPWDYTEGDVKALFSRLFGEVVSATVFDKGCNPDGRPVPKYGFVTFRKTEDCSKALKGRPIFVGNHMLNVQAKESKKNPKPASVPTAGGGGGGVGVGGGGLAGIIGEAEIVNGSNNGRANFPVGGSAEPNQPPAARHLHTLPTPTLHHHHQQPPPPTQPVTKPKFQRLLPSNSAVGTMGTLAPPKLVRPQPKVVPNPSKIGGQTTATKEENAAPASSISYPKLIEVCKQRLGKEFSSPEICTALREVRTHNNNKSLMELTTEKIVERVKQQLRARKAGLGAPSVAPWAGLTQEPGKKTSPEWQGPRNEEGVKEESCSICLESLNTGPTLPLQCLHTFHERCIKDWLRRQSNCPNCRKFALMTDEYPTLTQK